jgi:SPP1 gp7 family putative phage head morphogenesis protein
MAPYIYRKDRDRTDKVLRPVRPNIGLEVAYRRRLVELIEKMGVSVQHWIEQQYKRLRPEMAQDATPASELQAAVQQLVRQWMYNFDQAATELAHYFAQDVSQRSDAALLSALRKGGFAVGFTMTPAMRDIIDATVHQNVALIKSIPATYLSQVEGMVMRSVQTGRDIGGLAKELREQLGVTKRRAALIARSQNNLATAAMQRARQKEMKITEAIWMHSHGGKTPRPSHVKNNGKRYKISEGWYDPDEGKFILPGELINCRCVSRSVIPGLDM